MKVIPTQIIESFEPWVGRAISRLNQENRQIVLEFLGHLKLQGRSPSTIESYVLALAKFETNGKSYRDLTADDIRTWLHWLDSNGYSERTVNALRWRIKRFLKWVHIADDPRREAPEVLGELRPKRLRRELPHEILSRDEVRKLIDAANSQRDRALLFVAYESGARAGELLSLRLRDLEFDRYGAVLHVRGKTGERRIRLVESVPDLQLWCSMHPDRDNPDAALWPTRLKSRNPMGIAAFEWMLNRYAKLAGLRKHVHPHLLRHTRATHLASVLTEAQMREFFGWTKSSDMPEVYVHISGRDIDGTLLKHYGVEVEESERAEDVLKPWPCPRCKHQNPASAKFCMACSLPAGIPQAMEIQERRERAERVMEALTKWLIDNAPELLERFVKQPEVLRELQETA